MKNIFTIVNVKNESDIVESFCRYNLTYCDGMLIWDDGSSDNTRGIIQKLIDEGLPIHLVFQDDTEMSIETAKSKLANMAFNDYKADLVVPLDCDEFLYHINGINPRESLENLAEGIEYQIPWRTYVYDKEPDLNIGFVPNNFTYYRNPTLESAQGHPGKTLMSKRLKDDRQADYITGAHWLVYPQQHQGKVSIQNPDNLVIAHFPIRSQIQNLIKVIPFWISIWSRAWRADRESIDKHQLGMMFNELKKKGEVSAEVLKQRSIEYSLFSLGNSDEIRALMDKLGNEITVDGSMDTSYCQDKLVLHYTDYNEGNKTFLQATMKQIDTTLMALITEADDKANRLSGVTQELEELGQQTIELERQNDELTQLSNSLRQQITDIHSSRTWKVGNKMSKVFRLFVPARSS